MKLESLNKMKFRAFESSTIQCQFQIVGGQEVSTKYSSSSGSSGTDTLDRDTYDGEHNIEGDKVDYHRDPIQSENGTD